MIASDTAAASSALYILGHTAITALTEDSDAARIMNALYTPTLDAALSAHDWNFARLRAVLATLADAPAWGYDRQFQLPQSPFCLRELEVEDADEDAWDIETYISPGGAQYRVIVTDLTTVKIKYLARITDPTLWSSLFAEAFIGELAYGACYGLTRNDTLKETLRQEKERLWRLARGVDGQEGRPLKRLLSSSLTDVR